ncbi:hypothetical protein TNCT_421041 [Trichonephila clavata]|uniref:Uncharacterized protein n=1 Tax=Trichonephila clavata TaxID=2740835 RepID=A0A8X6FW06_TRICU|nr:hypothetical protein TNCT_421041 [Trichonephila clavata]
MELQSNSDKEQSKRLLETFSTSVKDGRKKFKKNFQQPQAISTSKPKDNINQNGTLLVPQNVANKVLSIPNYKVNSLSKIPMYFINTNQNKNHPVIQNQLLDDKGGIQYLPCKGKEEPTVLVENPRKHALTDYFYKKYQSFDMDYYNRNIEKLCAFQGKITSVFEDELHPNYGKTPSTLSVSEEEMNPNIKD